MSNALPPRIHPTAVISPEAVFAEGVEVGPHAVIEGQSASAPIA